MIYNVLNNNMKCSDSKKGYCCKYIKSYFTLKAYTHIWFSTCKGVRVFTQKGDNSLSYSMFLLSLNRCYRSFLYIYSFTAT